MSLCAGFFLSSCHSSLRWFLLSFYGEMMKKFWHVFFRESIRHQSQYPNENMFFHLNNGRFGGFHPNKTPQKKGPRPLQWGLSKKNKHDLLIFWNLRNPDTWEIFFGTKKDGASIEKIFHLKSGNVWVRNRVLGHSNFTEVKRRNQGLHNISAYEAPVSPSKLVVITHASKKPSCFSGKSVVFTSSWVQKILASTGKGKSSASVSHQTEVKSYIMLA